MAHFILANGYILVHNSYMCKNLFIAGLTAVVLPAFAAEWMTDLEAAKTKAAKEDKAVLVDFTGSDWCGYCIRLKKTVFDTPAFEQYAADKFILVEIDVPNDVNRVGGQENFKKNQALCREFKISGFPTIMVLNPTGAVMGGFVGGKPNLAALEQTLSTPLENNRKFNEAQKLEGLDKAHKLMEIYSSLPSEIKPVAFDMLRQITELDPDDATGIQTLVLEDDTMKKVEAQLRNCGRDTDKALTIVNEAIPSVSGTNKETLLQTKMLILQDKVSKLCSTAESTEDIAAIKALMLESADCLPEPQRKKAQAHVEKFFANPDAVLKQLKRSERK